MGLAQIKENLTVLKPASGDSLSYGIFIIVVILISFFSYGLMSGSDNPKNLNFVEASSGVQMFSVLGNQTFTMFNPTHSWRPERR